MNISSWNPHLSTYRSTAATSGNELPSGVAEARSVDGTGELAAVYERSSTQEPDAYIYTRSSVYSASMQASATVADAQSVYSSWFDSLGGAVDDYMNTLVNRIDAEPDEITNSEVAGMLNQHFDWLNQRLLELDQGLAAGVGNGDFTEEEAIEYIDLGRAVLENLDSTLWNGITNMVDIHRFAAEQLKETWSDWEAGLPQSVKNLFLPILSSIQKHQGTISEAKINEYMQQAQDWEEAQRLSFQQSITGAPTGLRITYDQRNEGMLQQQLATIMQAIRTQAIHKNTPPPQEEGITRYRREQPQDFEMQVGKHKATIKEMDNGSAKTGSMLRVMDAAGEVRYFSITFDHPALQREFDKRLKKSVVGDGSKAISFEKLQKALDKLKESLDAVSDTDLTRLKSRLYGKDAELKLTRAIDQFLLQLPPLLN